jgi:hypothetical protein
LTGEISSRAGFRVSARAGLHRFQDHRLSRATKKIAQCGGRDQPSPSDANRPKLTFADQVVDRTTRQTSDLGGVVNPVRKNSIRRKRNASFPNIKVN